MPRTAERRRHSSGYRPKTRFLVACLLLCAPATVPAIVARAESPRAISGVVVDAQTGSPLANVEIRAEDGELLRSDVHGRFTVGAVTAGTITLSFHRLGYRDQRDLRIVTAEGFERTVRVALAPLPQELPALEVFGQAELGVRRQRVTPERRAQVQSVADLIAQVPGVAIYGSAESPGGTRVSVGGEPAHRVAVLLDGLPLAGGVDGAVDLSSVPLDAVAAIEVYPGSRTASAGDAAVGGAVNLITTGRITTGETRIAGRAGRFGQHRESLTWAGQLGRLGLRVSGARSGRGATFQYPDSAGSALRRNAGSDILDGYLQVAPVGEDRFRITAFQQAATHGSPGPVEDESSDAQNDNRQSRVQAQYTIASEGALGLTVSAWYERIREQYRRPDGIPINTRFVERFVGVRGQSTYRAPLWESGLTWETRHRHLAGDDRQRPQLSFGTHARVEHDLRAHAARTLLNDRAPLTVAVAAAVNLDSDLPTYLTPRVDLTYSRHVTPGRLALRVGAGRSYRRPRLTSLFWKADANAAGNPELRPERAGEWDVEFRLAGRVGSIGTRYFERRIDDVIVWDKRGVPALYRPVNLDRARIDGREDQVAVRFGDKRHRLAVSYVHVLTDSRDDSGDRQYQDSMLVFTPRHTHEVNLTLTVGRLSAECAGRWVSRRLTTRAGTKWLDPYHAFDIRATAQLRGNHPRLTVQTQITNLTNERYELLGNYPQPGRAWSIGLTAGF